MLASLVLSMLQFSHNAASFCGQASTPSPPFRGHVWLFTPTKARFDLPRLTPSIAHQASFPNGFTWGQPGPGTEFLAASILHAVLPCPWVVLRTYKEFQTYPATFAANWELDAVIAEDFLRARIERLADSLIGVPRIQLPVGTLRRDGHCWLFTSPSGKAEYLSVLQAARLIANA